MQQDRTFIRFLVLMNAGHTLGKPERDMLQDRLLMRRIDQIPLPTATHSNLPNGCFS
jgi:hypothetical protein